MGINLPLGVDVLAHIDLDPNSWDQDYWARLWAPLNEKSGKPETAPECGTTFCAAGWACHLSGLEFAWSYLGGGEWSAQLVFLPEDGDQQQDESRRKGKVEKVESVAARLLGLETEWSELFISDNDRAALYGHIAQLAGLEPEQLYEQVSARIAELCSMSCAHCGQAIRRSSLDSAWGWLHAGTDDLYCDVDAAPAHAGRPGRTMAAPDRTTPAVAVTTG